MELKMPAKLDIRSQNPPEWGGCSSAVCRSFFRLSLMNRWRMAMRLHLPAAFAAFALLALSLVAANGFAADATASKSMGSESKSKSTAKPSDLGQRKEGEVGAHEDLSFREAKVAAEMTELEQRMFRLSEALKKVEPENSS